MFEQFLNSEPFRFHRRRRSTCFPFESKHRSNSSVFWFPCIFVRSTLVGTDEGDGLLDEEYSKVASETVTFIESKEMARDALANGTSTSAMSAYRKEKKNPSESDNKEKEKKTGKCPKCGKDYKLFKYFTNSRKYNAKPFSTCFSCKPKGKSNDVANTPEAAAVTTDTDVEAAGMFSSIGAVSHLRKHTQESQSVKSLSVCYHKYHS